MNDTQNLNNNSNQNKNMNKNPHKKKQHTTLPKDHPRYDSLTYRHKIIQGMNDLVVAEAGLIAHGRGECFDYILGEKTNESAHQALKTAVAALLLAKKPVISVNGNVAALIPEQLVQLSQEINAPLEINLFYRKKGRIKAIQNYLEDAGAKKILGLDESKMVQIEELSSNRRLVDPHGIKIADVVLVPLEDGDRTEALKQLGKTVIAIDLNPLSRTSLYADITIVDNVIRTIPLMIQYAQELKDHSEERLEKLVQTFNNRRNIQNCLDLIIQYIKEQKRSLQNSKKPTMH
ncbi:MAG: 4-phosphopantoate--beta-alanine ligase [Promethearchaeota archaeon]|nr:MAG: 4-phosphopantoate--beta-alanine ligase [Candidatus Lokiarchaeota archaeon]